MGRNYTLWIVCIYSWPWWRWGSCRTLSPGRAAHRWSCRKCCGGDRGLDSGRRRQKEHPQLCPVHTDVRVTHPMKISLAQSRNCNAHFLHGVPRKQLFRASSPQTQRAASGFRGCTMWVKDTAFHSHWWSAWKHKKVFAKSASATKRTKLIQPSLLKPHSPWTGSAQGWTPF